MNKNPLIIVIGAYGSGKSEYSINLAKLFNKIEDERPCGLYGTHLFVPSSVGIHTEEERINAFRTEHGGKKVSLADLDVVNPYFRSRDVQEILEREGIEVIAPESSFKHADLPMISPRVKGAIHDISKTLILDVGGDPAGCKALGRFVDDIITRTYEMMFVVNTKRPFTSNHQEIIDMITMLESTSGLKITEIVSNTNLMDYTDLALIQEGIEIVKSVAASIGISVKRYLVMNDTNNVYPDEILGVQKMNLEFFMKKPWNYSNFSID